MQTLSFRSIAVNNLRPIRFILYLIGYLNLDNLKLIGIKCLTYMLVFRQTRLFIRRLIKQFFIDSCLSCHE